jgi:CheY-like chemotaxis protein
MFLDKDEDIVALGTGTVLLMEDDEMTKDITVQMLQYLGYNVEAVTRGEDAVELYRQRKEQGRPFKAVILDINQPEGIGGEETLRRLLEYDPSVKAVASSGFTGHKTMTKPKAYGFSASLPKPYGIRQLGCVLRDVMGSDPGEKRLENRRKVTRQGTVAKFTFVVGDKTGDVCEGITINISEHGFGFITEATFPEGQDIAVTTHDLPNIAGRKARVLWMKKGPRHYEAGAKFFMAS